MAETILIVEDDPSIRKGLQLNLQVEGYRVLSATDGQEGLRLCMAEAPDLVLLDLMLPRLSGIELIQRLRQNNEKLPVLVLSAKDQEADKVLALSLGADDYITKPFGLAELLARVRAALRRERRQRREQAATHGSRIQLDLAGRRLFIDGIEVETTAREFDLLRFFIQHPGQVFSREQLMRRIWGEDYYGTPRTVDNFIARLRSKIERNPDQPVHLETIRGVGYRYNA
ncbi:MAG: response regulator transcription factor [Myxococcales bacterium]|nr:response regulator transcription factor [Myxococcota bacterium]MDW8281696.1 response regulator transcription factor [Myxococcales bacterium]